MKNYVCVVCIIINYENVWFGFVRIVDVRERRGYVRYVGYELKFLLCLVFIDCI